ncbi:hypothetical protein [Geobacter grbiciae]|uniref:hypothetical protein n=1 Tax=Geobacter grbiciae TaxID=155042 RepID=UPI001C00F6A9|nr:hypothetical protein [Geobacter grbiciae]MBT1074266.1 hypothetical protein [Geobacter grbiciae]
MRKKAIIGIALALGVFTGGTVFAMGCDKCDGTGGCKDSSAVEKLKSETAGLRSELAAKEVELRTEYSYNSINTARIEAIEREIGDIKAKIRAAATKLGIPAGCAA